jgi:hypothetical protein
VVLVDIGLPEMSGIDGIRLLKRDHTQLAILETLEKIIITVTCAHGGRIYHSVYPGSADWAWAKALIASPARLAA